MAQLSLYAPFVGRWSDFSLQPWFGPIGCLVESEPRPLPALWLSSPPPCPFHPCPCTNVSFRAPPPALCVWGKPCGVWWCPGGERLCSAIYRRRNFSGPGPGACPEAPHHEPVATLSTAMVPCRALPPPPSCLLVPRPALWVSWVPYDTTVKAGC